MDHREMVINNFGQTAANYRKSAIHGNAEKLAHMVSLLEPKSHFSGLDIATGAGHTALALAPMVNRVAAIDITEQMLAQARAEAAARCLANIDFIIDDVHNISFTDNSFDVVTCRYAAHHFSDICSAINEMSRVLKPGGQLYILDCTVVGDEETQAVVNQAEILRDNSHICLYSENAWGKMLSKAGFRVEYSVVTRTEYELPLWFDTIATPAENRVQVFQELARLSQEGREDYQFSANYITSYEIELLAILN
ncbi:MAG: class I SAM-dependent methyltransferase [Acidobacteriota bacterium]